MGTGLDQVPLAIGRTALGARCGTLVVGDAFEPAAAVDPRTKALESSVSMQKGPGVHDRPLKTACGRSTPSDGDHVVPSQVATVPLWRAAAHQSTVGQERNVAPARSREESADQESPLHRAAWPSVSRAMHQVADAHDTTGLVVEVGASIWVEADHAPLLQTERSPSVDAAAHKDGVGQSICDTMGPGGPSVAADQVDPFH